MSRILFVFFACLFASFSQAEQSKTSGDFTAHYNVFNSASLSADIARTYGVTRGGNQAVMTISVRKQTGATDTAAKASVKGDVQNLIGQKSDLVFKEINESQAIYYIATFRFDDKDHVKIKVDVTPVGGDLMTIDLTQQMFAEK